MENKRVLIVEHNMNKLSIINENKSKSNTPLKMTIGGVFTEFDIENRNKRFYTAENFIPCMNALLQKKDMLGVVYGELDHPEGFDISGQNASHVIESLVHNEAENRVDGSITLLSTPNGNIMRNIINDGYPVFVSSRAAGVTHNNQVALHELFTYDGVLDPGFANTRQTILESYGYKSKPSKLEILNESLGFDNSNDVPYRIYDITDDYDVETLFRDNKNDMKTKRDFQFMEQNIKNDLKQMEQNMMHNAGNKNISSDEAKHLMEKYEKTQEELLALKKYMEFFKRNYNVLVKENKTMKNELNENTKYYNHISNGLSNVQKELSNVKKETSIIGSFAEQVAESAKAEIDITQKFVEHVAEETKVRGEMLEYVANETKITQEFAEHIAKETKVRGEMLEYVAEKLNDNNHFTEYAAKEIELTQGLLEHIAHEYKKDNYYISYIADKVEGTKNFIKEELINTGIIKESNGKTIKDIDAYLGLDEEAKLLRTVENNIKQNTKTTKFDKFVENFEEEFEEDDEYTSTDDDIDFDTTDNFDATEFTNVDDVDNAEDFSDETEIPFGEEGSLENSLISALVNILGTDETGIVLEITPDDKLIIQKSGTEETLEMNQDEVEFLDTETNIVESVSTVLENIKKIKAQANRQPHFFEFLSEKEITDFRLLDNKMQNEIINVMEGATYFTEGDVLRLIGETLNKDNLSYEQRLIKEMPLALKDTWNNLSQPVKEGYIAESTFFHLATKNDIQSYWNTREFSKNLNSPKTIINENYDAEEFSPEFIEAFRKSAMGN